MQTKNTRIAYLKRMLKRLEGEDTRLKELVLREALSEEARNLLFNQLEKSRDEVLSELRTLENERC